MRYLTLVLVLLPLAASAGDRMDAAKNCKMKWPGNSGLIMACRNNQIADRGALTRLAKMSRQNREIVEACIARSPGVVQGTDWQDAMACARYYIKASKR